ncbi:hypothetical protein H101_05143 [Trichophyton interdigitale H6]|nr:hypothetical protein H101_05143 [Trichophyton interdigitale H6]
MAEPPAKDGLGTPNILKKLKAEREQHSYKDLLTKWGIPINESEVNIAKHLISKIFEDMAKNVGSIENDPSISPPLKDRYKAHPIPWGYCSDPWDHGTLLMRNRWYNLYERIPDLV